MIPLRRRQCRGASGRVNSMRPSVLAAVRPVLAAIVLSIATAPALARSVQPPAHRAGHPDGPAPQVGRAGRRAAGSSRSRRTRDAPPSAPRCRARPSSGRDVRSRARASGCGTGRPTRRVALGPGALRPGLVAGRRQVGRGRAGRSLGGCRPTSGGRRIWSTCGAATDRPAHSSTAPSADRSGRPTPRPLRSSPPTIARRGWRWSTRGPAHTATHRTWRLMRSRGEADSRSLRLGSRVARLP